SLKTSIKTITYLSDIGCLEIQGASLVVLFFLTNFLILRHLKATQFVIWHQKSMRHAGTPSIRNLI
ncbi:hypothetical protein OSL73_17040, partial [Escherichia coli]|nr:hypothetical protein [Escherichia coli]